MAGLPYQVPSAISFPPSSELDALSQLLLQVNQLNRNVYTFLTAIDTGVVNSGIVNPTLWNSLTPENKYALCIKYLFYLQYATVDHLSLLNGLGSTQKATLWRSFLQGRLDDQGQSLWGT